MDRFQDGGNTPGKPVITKEPTHPIIEGKSAMPLAGGIAVGEGSDKKYETETVYLDPGLLGTPEIKHKHELFAPILPPEPIEGVPLGLELLFDLNKIKVKRQAEFIPDVMSTYELDNRYDILNEHEKRIYFAAETATTKILTCGGTERPLQITILDFSGRVVLTMDRPCDTALYLTNCCFCCCFCLGRIGGKVHLGDGTFLGEIVHAFNCYCPLYNVLDPDGGLLMQIKGTKYGDCYIFRPFFTRGNTVFTVEAGDGEQVGIIQKEFARIEDLIGRRLFIIEAVDIHSFEVRFPEDLDLRLKALLLAAIFLLNSNYFKYEFPKYETEVKADLTRELDLRSQASESLDPSYTSFIAPSDAELYKKGLKNKKRPSVLYPFQDK